MITTYPSESALLKFSGFLYWNATNLSAEATWGELLGFTEDGIEIETGYRRRDEIGEEFGEEPIMSLYLGCSFKIRATLKTWNDATIAQACPGLATTSAIQYPNTILSGTRLDSSTYAKRLFFVGDDGGEENPVMLAQAAVGSVISPIFFRLKAVTTLTLEFSCFRKGSGTEIYRSVYVGPKSGAVLI